MDKEQKCKSWTEPLCRRGLEQGKLGRRTRGFARFEASHSRPIEMSLSVFGFVFKHKHSTTLTLSFLDPLVGNKSIHVNSKKNHPTHSAHTTTTQWTHTHTHSQSFCLALRLSLDSSMKYVPTKGTVRMRYACSKLRGSVLWIVLFSLFTHCS